MAALFPLGRITATPGALQTLVKTGTDPMMLLERQTSGDRGDVSVEDATENQFSLVNGFRIMSAYTLDPGVQLWVITEADRSLTTLLLPGEY